MVMGPFPLIYSKKKEYLLTVKKVLSLYQVFVFMEQNNTYFCGLTRLISYQFIVSVVWVELSWVILLLFFVVSSVDVIMLGFGYMWVVQKWPQLFINGVVCQLSISLAGSLILMVARPPYMEDSESKRGKNGILQEGLQISSFIPAMIHW